MLPYTAFIRYSPQLPHSRRWSNELTWTHLQSLVFAGAIKIKSPLPHSKSKNTLAFTCFSEIQKRSAGSEVSSFSKLNKLCNSLICWIYFWQLIFILNLFVLSSFMHIAVVSFRILSFIFLFFIWIFFKTLFVWFSRKRRTVKKKKKKRKSEFFVFCCFVSKSNSRSCAFMNYIVFVRILFF